jgi:histidine ammonia-lyase
MILSHAVGVGEDLSAEVVRAMLLLRANALAKGYSGVRLLVVEALLGLLNHGVYPVIPCKGSVGSSGDLAPLSHLTLTLIGEGEADFHGQRMRSADALAEAGLEPLTLGAKEGLALVNGTTAMTAIAALALRSAENLAQTADIAGAMSLEAMRGVPQAFDARLHALRPYPGQNAVAAHLRQLIEGSELLSRQSGAGMNPDRVHDAYCLRCMPQVHGAVRDALAYVRQVVSIELNSVTDNPLIFADEAGAAVVSGGNFHGEPVALAMDMLAIAVAELGSISERRLARLIDSHANEHTLPPFLTPNSGVNSGFMLVQYTAAALVSENKVLAHPASVDSIPTSAGMEDHVSMGTIAARKAAEVTRNVSAVLALELMAAGQGLDLRLQGGEVRMGVGTGEAWRLLRERVPFMASDQLMVPHVQAACKLVESEALSARLGDALWHQVS